MVWIALAALFCWLIYREVRATLAPRADMPSGPGISKSYVGILAGLAVVCLWQPLSTKLLEHRLSGIATELADGRPARVHCNTVTDTMFDQQSTNIGHASPTTGAIVFQYPWCNTFSAFLRHPARADLNELTSLGLLTHESMHVRGEMNEAVTECEAVQRNLRTARLLGIPEKIARHDALAYYYTIYQRRQLRDGDPDRYYSTECHPGGALDERLADASWTPRPSP